MDVLLVGLGTVLPKKIPKAVAIQKKGCIFASALAT